MYALRSSQKMCQIVFCGVVPFRYKAPAQHTLEHIHKFASRVHRSDTTSQIAETNDVDVG